MPLRHPRLRADLRIRPVRRLRQVPQGDRGRGDRGRVQQGRIQAQDAHVGRLAWDRPQGVQALLEESRQDVSRACDEWTSGETLGPRVSVAIMSYLESQVFMAWVSELRLHASEEFKDELARAICWVSLTLKNDRLRE